MSILGAMSKRKSCKIDRIVWEMHAMSSFGLSFCECMHAYLLPIHYAEILRKFRRISPLNLYFSRATIHIPVLKATADYVSSETKGHGNFFESVQNQNGLPCFVTIPEGSSKMICFITLCYISLKKKEMEHV